MKTRCIVRYGVVTAVLVLLSSCVTMEQDMRYLNDQIVALNARVSALEGTLSGDLPGQLRTLKEHQAEVGQDVERFKAEIQRFSGRLEENKQLVQRAVERDTTDQDLMVTNLNALTQKVAELEARLTGSQGAQGVVTAPGPSAVPRAQAPVAPQPVAPAPPAAQPEAVSPQEGMYKKTLALYEAGDYEGTIAGFKSFLTMYPSSEFADNAQFWIGESHMSMKQYEQAILAYQQVIKKYPKGNKVPNAMLRQALAFQEIKDVISARLLLQKIIKNYPGSREATTANTRLKTLK